MKAYDYSQIQDLQSRLADGDELALKLLFQQFGKRLHVFAYGILHSNEMAEEVVEDVFIQVWKLRQRVSEVENLVWYLYTTTKNLSCSYLRKYGREQPFCIDELTLPYLKVDANPEEIAISNETLQRVHLAINNLPPRCRQIFKLVKEDGLKYREVAELLEVSLKTVENQVGIALKKIHAALESLVSVNKHISEK